MTANLRLVNFSNVRRLLAVVSLFADETSRKCTETSMRTYLKCPNQASCSPTVHEANFEHKDANMRNELPKLSKLGHPPGLPCGRAMTPGGDMRSEWT